MNLFYSEQAVGNFGTTRNFQTTSSQPAYLWDYGTEDNYNNRKQSSVNAKVDYRLSAATKVSLNTIYNDAFERFRLRYGFRAYTGSATVVPNATSGIVPGFTDRLTEVRAVAGSNVDITSQMSNFFHRQRHVDLNIEHKWGALEVDYGWALSVDHINGGGGDGGALVNRNIAPVGWILDRTQSDLYPRFIQTGGADFTNPANYRPPANGLANSLADTDQDVDELGANVRYTLPTAAPAYLKAGVLRRAQHVQERANSRRWNYLGTTALPADPSIVMFDQVKTGRNIPQWDAAPLIRNREPVNPALFRDTADNPVDTAGKACQCLPGSLGIGGLGIIDNQGAARMAERLHPVRQTGEGAQTAPDRLPVHTQSQHRCNGCRRVLGIVHPAQRGNACQIGHIHFPVGPVEDKAGAVAADAVLKGIVHRQAHKRMVLPFELIGNLLAKRIIDTDHRQTGLLHQPLFDRRIQGHRAVAVEMVGGQIGQNPDSRRQRRSQIDLEGRTFDHMHAGLVRHRQRQNGRADIAAHRHITPRHLQQMGNQSCGGGFAVGAGNRHTGRIGRDQGSLAEEQFDIADDLDTG